MKDIRLRFSTQGQYYLKGHLPAHRLVGFVGFEGFADLLGVCMCYARSHGRLPERSLIS